MPWFRFPKPIESPVLVVDALGVSERIATSSAVELSRLADSLDKQFYGFRARIPNRLVITICRQVFGTRELRSLQLNDMFVMYSVRQLTDPTFLYLVSSSILYHQLLSTGFLLRGGLGFGLILQRNQMILGKGFLDAYRTSEKRPDATKNICAFEVSRNFVAQMQPSERAWRLLCLYSGRFFINPRCLVDPELGAFDTGRILSLLDEAGINEEKRIATKSFLDGFEDYDDALKPHSASRRIAGWDSVDER